jgi:hypothetical protein
VLKTSNEASRNGPGRSMKLRSVMSGPLMCRTMQFEENDISDWLKSLSAPEIKLSVGTDGFKMAL